MSTDTLLQTRDKTLWLGYKSSEVKRGFQAMLEPAFLFPVSFSGQMTYFCYVAIMERGNARFKKKVGKINLHELIDILAIIQ